MNIKDLKHLEIKFETADILPPPFSHQILLTLDFQKDFIDTKFEIAYTYRDELSDEEILEEGFTGEEDLAWAGELSNAWKQPILDILKQMPERNNQKAIQEEQNFLEISVDNKVFGNPKNQEEWEYLLNELSQAVYETYGKELPLSLVFKKVESGQAISKFGLTLHYIDRSVEAFTEIDSENKSRSISWEEANELIGQVFIGDFIQDKAVRNEPKSIGKFITVGDGLWYEFTKSLKNPNGNRAYITSLYQRFEEYF
ncbi:MAG: hypothetical protein V4585_22440 [Bacteroidota bacterium]|jgi:hypothetical protein